ncbi:hypothetical protein HPB50_017072 [Hyalomma asiaticum]|uniref:Uncharacterized protein n=1 Tax=Hyalomma asiaticum TaxID=266040 RepID=A0ACB7SP23_HYAAI|nr:hypothetical protein HPB50_017072 [Hyalomma asiaticum]
MGGPNLLAVGVVQSRGGLPDEAPTVRHKAESSRTGPGVETEKWREARKAKSALAVYSTSKAVIAKEGIYDNSKRSRLLCDARSGVRARYVPG